MSTAHPVTWLIPVYGLSHTSCYFQALISIHNSFHFDRISLGKKKYIDSVNQSGERSKWS